MFVPGILLLKNSPSGKDGSVLLTGSQRIGPRELRDSTNVNVSHYSAAQLSNLRQNSLELLISCFHSR